MDKNINLDVARDNLTSQVINAALQVHKEFGPGLLESAYEACLSIALWNRNISHKKQICMPIIFEE